MAAEGPRANQPSQRWSQLRLVVTRNAGGTAEVTLVVRQAAGAARWDTKLGWTRIAAEPGSPESVDAIPALRSALEALQRVRDGVA